MKSLDEFMRGYSRRVVGPTMLEYTRWILAEAQKKNIKRVYFLARDGYLLFKIAKALCDSGLYNIDCRYLYCSRASLRMPSYHIIPRDEMYDILLLGGFYLTAKTVLLRAQFSEEELLKLYKELDIKNPDARLNDIEFNLLCEKIKNCKYYEDTIIEKSKAQHEVTCDYLKQNGLLDDDCIAIADSGWTGSMQRSLRQLVQSCGYNGKIIGFYFGMFVNPKDDLDGEYNTFYFNSNEGNKRKIRFNNNLFECMLSAPHQMTVKYNYSEKGTVAPIFADSNPNEHMQNLINAQMDGALEYVNHKIITGLEAFDYKKSLSSVYKILNRAMVYPTREEARMYSLFTFCDDITEKYSISLADKESKALLSSYMIHYRVFRKLFGKKRSDGYKLFWPFGVIAFCPKILRPWYRFNILTMAFLKSKLNKTER